MRLIVISSVAALFVTSSVASAETFTFTGSTTPGMQIAGPGPMGKPIFSGSFKGQTSVTWASGKKSTSTSDCNGWSAPPGSGFSVQGMCQSTDSDGSKQFLAFSCISLNDKNTMSDCWGRMTGTAGPAQGKTSTASWRGTQNADGKGSTLTGAGVQN